MDKLRILFLITDLGKGGAERYLVDLCNYLLKKDDIEFVIGSLYDNNQYKNETASFNIVNLNYQTFSFFKKNESIPLKKLINQFEPHIIHTHRFLGEFLSSLEIRKNILYVCHGHDNMEQLANFRFSYLFSKKKIVQWAEKQYLILRKYSKVSTHIIANSKHTYDFYIRNLSRKPLKTKIHLVYYGFNFEKFKFQQHQRLNTPLRLINVGSFQTKKNQQFLIDVGVELQKRKIPFIMELAGHGELYEKVKNKVIEHKLENQIFMPGIIHDIQDKYKESDIYIHSARYEPFGLVFLEAMASGLPVVSLNGKGNECIIENGKNGFMIDNEDAVLFVDKIELLINNPSLYSSISQYCIDYASSFTMENHFNKLKEIYGLAKR